MLFSKIDFGRGAGARTRGGVSYRIILYEHGSGLLFVVIVVIEFLLERSSRQIASATKGVINIRSNQNLFFRIRNAMWEWRGGSITTLCTQRRLFDHIIAIWNQAQYITKNAPTIIAV